MFYEKHVTIPPNTLSYEPIVESIPVHPGILKKVEIVFPSGCAGLVHCQITYWERQVFPTNPDSDFTGDDSQIVFEEDIELKEPPFEFNVVAWSEDDTYEHTLLVRMQVILKERSLVDIMKLLTLGPSGAVERKE